MKIVIDNFLEKPLLDYLCWCIPMLYYEVHGSVSGKNNFLKTTGDFVDHNVFKYIAEEKINKIPEIKVDNYLRAYVNLNPPGEWCSGDYHQDDGFITALFYPMPWDKKYGGGTEFEDGSSVAYKQNRLVLFDAHLMHRAIEHNNKAFRYSIAYKMEASWV